MIKGFGKDVNGNVVICYMEFVWWGDEYMEEFGEMYEEVVMGEEEFVWNVGYGDKISLKDGKGLRREGLKSCIGKSLLGMLWEI